MTIRPVQYAAGLEPLGCSGMARVLEWGKRCNLDCQGPSALSIGLPFAEKRPFFKKNDHKHKQPLQSHIYFLAVNATVIPLKS